MTDGFCPSEGANGGACADELHEWEEDLEIISSYEVASSYESGNEYGPYHTEYVYGDTVVGRHCKRCGKIERYESRRG